MADVAGDGPSGGVTWLTEARSGLTQAPAWQALAKAVYARVQRKLSENHVQFFSELSGDEKSLLLEEIEDGLADDPVYTSFQELLSSTLDERISDAVERELRAPSNRRTKAQLVVEKASIGVTDLLRGIPGEKKTLQLLLNQTLPGPLRPEVWKMYLVNREERVTFEKRVANRRVNTISNIDADITQRCQTLLDTQFSELGERRGLLMVMKTLLSYYHVSTGSIDDPLYFLAIPLVLVYGDDFAHLPAVVEALFALVEASRPRFPLLTADPTELVQRTKLVKRVVGLLQDAHPLLYKAMYDVCAAASVDPALDGADIVDADKLRMTLAQLIQPSVEQLFVGVLSLEATLYAWDQCLLVGFDRVVVPIAVCSVLLLERPLLKCETPQALARTVATQAKTIPVAALQKEMERRFMPTLRDQLGVPLRGMSRWAVSDAVANVNTGGDVDDDDLADFAIEEQLDAVQPEGDGARSAEEVKAEVTRRYEEKLALERREIEAEERARPKLRAARRRKMSQDVDEAGGENESKDNHVDGVGEGIEVKGHESKDDCVTTSEGNQDGQRDVKAAPSQTASSVTIEWQGEAHEIKIATVDTAIDRLEDTAHRTIDLNAKALTGGTTLAKSEQADLTRLAADALRKALPELKPSRGKLLKIKVKDRFGVPTRCYFRLLEDGEKREVADRIVLSHLERGGLETKIARKIAQQLIKDSVKAGWSEEGGPTRSGDAQSYAKTAVETDGEGDDNAKEASPAMTKQQRKAAKKRKPRDNVRAGASASEDSDAASRTTTDDSERGDALVDLVAVTMQALRLLARGKTE